MELTTHLQQILRRLFYKTDWKYAVFWKLKHGARMMLTWEDAYYDNNEQINLPHHMRFQETPDLQDPLGLIVAKMSYLVYSLGEGIVGKVAVTGKHQWIFADSPSHSWLSSECCDGWKAQFSAGIKTVALVAVVPHGVVQLGSLDTVIEDKKLVTHIKDVFSSLKNSTMEFIPYPTQSISCSSLCLSGVSAKSSGSEILNDFPRSSNMTVCNKVTDAQSNFLPAFAICDKLSNDLLSLPTCRKRNSIEPVSEIVGCYSTTVGDVDSVKLIERQSLIEMKPHHKQKCAEEISGLEDMSFCSKPDESSLLYRFHAENSCFGNFTLPHDKSEEDYPFLPMNFIDSAVGDGIGSDKVFHVQNMNVRLSSLNMQLKASLEQKSETEGSCIDHGHTYLKFSTGCELHEALGPNFRKQKASCAWSESERRDNAITGSLEGTSDSLLTSDSGSEYLLEAVIANACTLSQNVKRETSLSKSAESLLTTGKTSQTPKHVHHVSALTNQFDVKSSFHVENDAHQHVNLIWDSTKVCKVGSPKDTSSKTLSAYSKQSDMQAEPTKITRKRARPGESCRPRPRDRQLIQDRVKELRELVPNGSKCSIDSLLERTIKHMLFLQSMIQHADKLRKCSDSKLHESRMNIVGPCSYQRGSSWAVEVGSQMEICPIIVENLNMDGQMLVKMLCEESGNFLEIAEAIRSLGLTILKGVTEAHGVGTWACFIVEGPKSKGIYRMDVLWSLMQLLQPRTAT